MSPVMDGQGYENLCFTFWYAAFGTAETTMLYLYKSEPTENMDTSSRSMVNQLLALLSI
jgi:hypothetical protein